MALWTLSDGPSPEETTRHSISARPRLKGIIIIVPRETWTEPTIIEPEPTDRPTDRPTSVTSPPIAQPTPTASSRTAAGADQPSPAPLSQRLPAVRPGRRATMTPEPTRPEIPSPNLGAPDKERRGLQRERSRGTTIDAF